MAKRSQIAPLLDYVPLLQPRYTRPEHLARLAARLERARFEPLRLVVSCPVRHGKTELIISFLVWLLAQDPSVQIVYASYAARLAEKKSRKARELARHAGVPIAEDASSRANWMTGYGDGGVWATGVTGSLTGEGADVVIVDDAHKDRAEAESATTRQAVWDWWNDVAATRMEPEASAIVCGARWHQDDLPGRLIAAGWESIVFPALDDEGRALWPERFSAEELVKIREERGAYTWASLYQQDPRAKGGQVFGDVVYYDSLPERYSITVGCDLAYSERTHADYSVAVVCARAGNLTYVVDVVRAQEEAPKFRERLAALKGTYPGASWRSYLAGTEKGVADVFRYLGVDLGAMRPIGDKFIRAQPVAAAWNAGRVLLPKSAHWLNRFVEELKSFSGVKDRHDDQVDALAAGFDAYGDVLRREAHAAETRRIVEHLNLLENGDARDWQVFEAKQLEKSRQRISAAMVQSQSPEMQRVFDLEWCQRLWRIGSPQLMDDEVQALFDAGMIPTAQRKRFSK